MFPLLVDQNASSNDGGCGAIVVAAAPSTCPEVCSPPDANIKSNIPTPRTANPLALLPTTMTFELVTSTTGADRPPPTPPAMPAPPWPDAIHVYGGGSSVLMRYARPS